jgi:GNAT superfamily N-acetyltransferase
MRIRGFMAADAEACADLLTWAGNVVPPVDVPEFRRVTEAEVILVAERAAETVGFLSFYRPDHFIHHLYVSPSHWRLGIGRALLSEALIRLEGVARLKCQEQNLGARAFYRRLGWIEQPGGIGSLGTWLWLEAPKENGRQG